MNSLEDVKVFYGAIIAEDVQKVKNLVESHKVDVNYRFPEHNLRTATHIAASFKNITLLKVLVEELKSSLSIADAFEQVPIENAAGHFNYNAIKYLIARDPSLAVKVADHINDPEVDKFFEAVQANDVNIVRTFLESKTVDVNSPNRSNFNNTALHTACENMNIEMVKLLVDDFNADVSLENISEELSIHLTNCDEIAKFLVSRGSDDLD